MAKPATPDLDKFYIEEFLFRGRSKDDARPTAWHLIVGVEGTDPVGRPHEPLPIMTSEQAIAHGWDLPTVIKEINAELLENLEAERAKTLQLDREKADIQAALVAEQAKSTAVVAERDALLVEIEATRTSDGGHVEPDQAETDRRFEVLADETNISATRERAE